ncbi:MAG: 1-phosphofructokinase family hexose kinase [Chloroflexota bacterium]|nr:1-phosphofructokinase family hexose kinase [Chloroflexota bacterium]MDE2907852.1 1-phosphofructokinase family hexose kinase [Chloroflexota bacterium]
MDKVVTLTLNPALDVATRIHSVAPEIKLRCAAPGFHPGGGGINVSRAIHFLGFTSSAVYAAGGHNGAMLTQLLTAEGIDNYPVEIAGVTRENVVVYEESTGLQYRFTLPGPALSADEWVASLETLFNLNPAYIVASGSLPAGVPLEFYGEITRYARERGIRVILDTAGDALNRAIGKGVYLLKPNLRELERYAGEALPGEAAIRAAGQRLIAGGLAEVMLVSLGAAGAALITRADCVMLRAPIVPIQSKVGAGDSMVGGIVLGLAQGFDLIDAARLGVAAGSAAVMTAGTELCRAEDAWRLYEEVRATHRVHT